MKSHQEGNRGGECVCRLPRVSASAFVVVRAGAFAALFASMALLSGCKRSQAPIVEPKPPEVTVIHPVYENVREYEDYTGRTESIPTVEVRARVTSQLKKIYFVDGTDVHKGDLLFDLDSRQYDAELERAKATQAQTEATLLQKAAALKRSKELREKGTNTQEELENAQADFDVAKALRDLAVANRKVAEINVGYCHIEAEIDGRLSRRMIDEGNQVAANVTPLTTIVNLNPIYADFDVDERTLLRLRRLLQAGDIKSPRETKTKLDVGLADEEGFSLNGTIDFSDNRVDPGTGTLRVRVRIENSDISEQVGPILALVKELLHETSGISIDTTPSKIRLLSPGMFVRVRFWIGDPQPAILVPEAALVSDQGIRHLFILNAEDKVEYRPVTIGLQQGDRRVIKSGVTTSDRVIVSGLQRVRPGILVKPTEAKVRKPAPVAKSEVARVSVK